MTFTKLPLPSCDIDRLAALFASSYAALGVVLPANECRRLAGLVAGGMTGPRRLYHSLRHLFEVCDGMDPIQTLAGIFHDLVYVQLDEGLPAPFAELLGDVLRPAGERFCLDLAAAGDDPWPAWVAQLFGVCDGQHLGLADSVNELASALLAARLLQYRLPPRALLAVVAAIEATIPFRPDMPASLLGRLRATAQVAGLPCSEAELHAMVGAAVGLANRDIAGLADVDAGRFLARTWLLIVEGNPPLADERRVSVQDYRRALARMAAFLDAFEPARVFQSFAGEPSSEQCAALAESLRANLAFAGAFFACKLVAAAVVEAAALLSGGDCAVADLLGHIRERPGASRSRIEDVLPAIADHPLATPALLDILRHGRPDEDPHNGLRSPFSAYVHASLGLPATCTLLIQAQAMFAGHLGPDQFLQTVPDGLRRVVLAACARQCPARGRALLELAK